MSFMPLFPHAALIREPGCNIIPLSQCGKLRRQQSHARLSRGSQISRVKASLLAKGIGPRSVRNDLTFGVSRHTQLAAAVLIPLQGIASSCEGSTSDSRRRNLTFYRQILTLGSENRVIISFLPAETSLCLVSLRSKATFDRKNITFRTDRTSSFFYFAPFRGTKCHLQLAELEHLANIIRLCTPKTGLNLVRLLLKTKKINKQKDKRRRL
jgi:hypothetical protein